MASEKKEKNNQGYVVNLYKLTQEQLNRVPKKGDIFIYNYTERDISPGRNRVDTDIRGCYRVVDDSHPIFIVCEEFYSEGMYGAKIVTMYRKDFYAGSAVAVLVERPYYKTETTWSEFAIKNFM